MIILTLACNKKDEERPNVIEDPETRYNLIINKSWYMTSWVVSPQLGNDTNLFKNQFPCFKDDTSRYLANNVLELDEGREKCKASNPQITYSNWSFSKNMDTLSRINDKLFILELNNKILKLQTQQKFGNDTYIYIVTYQHD
jgi:hypothetical protein